MLKRNKMVEMVNVSPNRVKVPDLGVDVAPGEKCTIEEGYVLPFYNQLGKVSQPIINYLAPCAGCKEVEDLQTTEGKIHPRHPALLPAKEEDKGRMNSPTGPSQAPRMPTVAEMVAAGVPEGIAEQLVRAAEAARLQAKEV